MFLTEFEYKETVVPILGTLPNIKTNIDRRVVAIRLAYPNEQVIIQPDLVKGLSVSNTDIFTNTCDRYGIIYNLEEREEVIKIVVVREQEEIYKIAGDNIDILLMNTDIEVPVELQKEVINLISWNYEVSEWIDRLDNDYVDCSEYITNLKNSIRNKNEITSYDAFMNEVNKVVNKDGKLLLTKNLRDYSDDFFMSIISDLILIHKKDVIIPEEFNNIYFSKLIENFGYFSNNYYNELMKIKNIPKISILLNNNIYLCILKDLNIVVKSKNTYLFSDNDNLKIIDKHIINIDNVIDNKKIININFNLDNVNNNIKILSKYFEDEVVDVDKLLFEKVGEEIYVHKGISISANAELTMISCSKEIKNVPIITKKVDLGILKSLLPLNTVDISIDEIKNKINSYLLSTINNKREFLLNCINSSNPTELFKDIRKPKKFEKNYSKVVSEMKDFLNLSDNDIMKFIKLVDEYTKVLLILIKYITVDDSALVEVLGRDYNRNILKTLKVKKDSEIIDYLIGVVGKENLRKILSFQRNYLTFCIYSNIYEKILDVKSLENIDDLLSYNVEYIIPSVLRNFNFSIYGSNKSIDIYNYLSVFPLGRLFKNSNVSKLLSDISIYNEFGYPAISEDIISRLPHYETSSTRTQMYILPNYM